MTLGLDTSVVVRLLVGTPEKQANAARKRIETAKDRGDTIQVTSLVIGETYYALKHHYQVPEATAREALLAFLDSGIPDEFPRYAILCLSRIRGAGLMDLLIHYSHRQRGAITLTLDKKQAKLEGASLLEPSS